MENGVLLRNSTSMSIPQGVFAVFAKIPSYAARSAHRSPSGSEEPAFLIFYSGQHFVFSHLCQLSVLFIECPERFKTADDLTAGI